MAKRWEEVQCELHADKAGVLWDLLLYVPTVGFLLLMGVRLWYAHGDDEIVGQVLMFLGFFLFDGGWGSCDAAASCYAIVADSVGYKPGAYSAKTKKWADVEFIERYSILCGSCREIVWLNGVG